MGVASNRRIDFVETLGQGGFGAVYLADVYGDNDFVQRLAIKILSEEMTALDDIAARQRDEARLLAQLNHHHIVKVIDLTTINGRPAVLMEYVEGADCAQLGQQGPLSVRAALEVVAAASSALAAAWEAPSPRTGRPLRVVHRDIKPANLLVSRHGGVKVLDFGVARGEFEREGKTESVQFGTARFMAPETWLHGEVSHKSDIFALGITLVELMARDKPGRAPLLPERFATWAQDLVEAGLPTRAQDRWRDGLSGLMASMLAFEPDARPDAATVHEALLGLLEGAEGLSLSRLARDRVPPLIEARRRQYAGVPMMSSIQVQAEISAPSLLVDPSDAAAATPLPAPASRGRGWMWAAALTTGFALLGAGTLVLVGVVAWKSGGATPEAALEVGAADASLSQPDVVAVDAPPQVPVDAPDAAPASALDASIDGSAAPVAGAAPPPTPTTASSSRRSSRAATPTAADAPVEAKAAPTAVVVTARPDAPAEAAPTQTTTYLVRISADAVGGRVYVDGKDVGAAPVRDLPLTPGTHLVRFERDGQSSQKSIQVSAFQRTFQVGL